MNDCFWYYICGEKCSNKYKCKKYIDINTQEGEKLLKEYQNDVDQTLIPVTNRWKEKFNAYKRN